MTHSPSPTEGKKQGLLSRREAAAKLQMSVGRLSRLTHPRGPIACIRFGRAVYYSSAELEDYIMADLIRLAEEALG